MPIFGLPNLLEININNILDTSTVTSWNIHGDTKSVQISIRFTMEDAFNIDTANVTFRKVPPSQLKRDRNRASLHKQSVSHSHKDSTRNQQEPNLCEEILDNGSHDQQCAFNSASNVPVSPLHIEQQVDGLTDTPDHMVNNSITENSAGHSDTATCERSDMVIVYGAGKEHRLNSACFSCSKPLEGSDLVKCCFIGGCDSMYCEYCLKSDHNTHKKHHPYMHSLKTLKEYMMKPG